MEAKDEKKQLVFISILLFIIIGSESGFFGLIIHFTQSTYQTFFEKREILVNFSTLKIQNDWYLVSDNDEKAVARLVLFDDGIKYIYLNIYKNNTSFKNNFFYFDPNFCIKKNENITFDSPVLFTDKNTTKLFQFPSEIVFCDQSKIANETYVAYFNKGLLALIVAQPYQVEQKSKYIEIFKNLQFRTNEEDLPDWLKKRIEK